MNELNRKLVATVRSATGAALHVCKRALEEAKGNVESAVQAVKKMGHAFAEKKADRATSAGCIVGQVVPLTTNALQGGLLACESETDFVSTNTVFIDFAKQALELGLKAEVQTLDALLNLPFNEDQTVEQARQSLVGQVGENIRISRFNTIKTVNHLGLYVHKGRYGCITDVKGPSAAIAKDIAVHIVVSHPKDVSELLQQDFYKDPTKKVAAYLEENASTAVNYVHFVLGSE